MCGKLLYIQEIQNTEQHALNEVKVMTNLVYVDLETGGIPVTTGIYEVGLIATVDGHIVDSLTIGLPINPSRLNEGMGQGYACISDEDIYINQFKSFMAKHPYPFVAHNASFDKGFLVHYGWVESNAIFHDTLERFRNIIPKTDIANYKLATILDYYGVQVEGTLHTAMADLKGLVAAVNASGMFPKAAPTTPASVWAEIHNDSIEGVNGEYILKVDAWTSEEQNEEGSVIAVITGRFTPTGVHCMWSAIDKRAQTDKQAIEKIKEGIKKLERHIQEDITRTATDITMHYYHPINGNSDEVAVAEANATLKELLKHFDFKIISQEIDKEEMQEVKTYLSTYGSTAVLHAIMEGKMYQIYSR